MILTPRLVKSMLFATMGSGALLMLGAVPAAANDPAAGKIVFQRQCQTCHIDSAEGPKRLGPTMFGLVGRKTGQVEGFRYSEANKNAGFAWSPEKLDEYLKNPRAVIPGTTMAFAGVRQDADRANLIAYLQTLK